MGEFVGVQAASGVSAPDIRAFVVYNGELIAAGSFSAADSQITNGIARWDGAAWQPLGSGFNGTVNALCVYNGALVAGGTFTSAGGQAASNVASWNGSAWAAIRSCGTARPVAGSSRSRRRKSAITRVTL